MTRVLYGTTCTLCGADASRALLVLWLSGIPFQCNAMHCTHAHTHRFCSVRAKRYVVVARAAVIRIQSWLRRFLAQCRVAHKIKREDAAVRVLQVR